MLLAAIELILVWVESRLNISMKATQEATSLALVKSVIISL